MNPPLPPPLLDVRDLRLGFRQGRTTLAAVDGISFTVQAGKTLALLGESGCGKSVTALSLLRLLPDAGRVLGGEVLRAPRKRCSRPSRARAYATLPPTIIRLPGEMPSPANPPSGCHFHPRCPQASELCRFLRYPPEKTLSTTHFAACHVL